MCSGDVSCQKCREPTEKCDRRMTEIYVLHEISLCESINTAGVLIPKHAVVNWQKCIMSTCKAINCAGNDVVLDGLEDIKPEPPVVT